MQKNKKGKVTYVRAASPGLGGKAGKLSEDPPAAGGVVGSARAVGGDAGGASEAPSAPGVTLKNGNKFFM